MKCSHACYAAQARLANLHIRARRPGSLPPSVEENARCCIGRCRGDHPMSTATTAGQWRTRSIVVPYIICNLHPRKLVFAGAWLLFGAYTLADQTFSFTAHGTTSTSQQLPVNIWRSHAIPEDTYSDARDASCSAPISSTPYHEGPAHATTCTDL